MTRKTTAMKILSKIKYFINKLKKHMSKKKAGQFFKDPSELVFTPFTKMSGRDNALKLSRNSKTFMSGRFKSGY